MAGSQPVDVVAYQVGGNLILLGPLGFLLPALFSRSERLSRTLLDGLVVTLVIEFVQLFTSQLLGFIYKLFHVDDILLNTAGVVFGWTLGGSFRNSPRFPRSGKHIKLQFEVRFGLLRARDKNC